MDFKENIRRKYLKIRDKITCRDNKSKFIIDKLCLMEEYKKSKVIALYYPIKSEINIIPLIEECLKENKVVLLPKVINKTDMIFVKINALDEVSKSNIFSLMEPISNEPYYEQIDLMIVPCVCASSDGYRIGYGQGYYDNYLSKNEVKFTVGIVHKECYLEDSNFRTINDVRLNKIVTD